MIQRGFCLSFVAATALVYAPLLLAADSGPIPIASGTAQLFVDDFLIDTQQNLTRTLHQPRKDDGGNSPVIAIDDEFGVETSTLEANGTIMYDPRLKKWVMYAVGFAATIPGERTRIYRFTSNDALQWVKGDTGTPEHIKIDLFDPVTGQSATNTDLTSFCYDKKDSEHPYKGWAWFANWGDKEGIYYLQSADGHTWDRGPEVMRMKSWKFQQDGRDLAGPGDVTTFYQDPLSNRYLALIKFNSVEPVGPKNLLRSRSYAFFDSLDKPFDVASVDHVELLPAAAEKNGDLPHDEYYASTAWRYESLWLGGLKVWHGGGDYPYSAAGCAFLKLAVSRDGLNWKKVQFKNDAGDPEVFIPNGEEGGNNGRNDGGYMTEFSQAPLRIGDELIYYYGSTSWGKNHPRGQRVTGGGIFRARLRPDGFVSVDGGSLTTKPLSFEGNKLRVNAVGPVQVEVLDQEGKQLGNAKIDGDSLKHPVSFSGRSLREIAPKGVARLRFTPSEKGQLYSFTVE